LSFYAYLYFDMIFSWYETWVFRITPLNVRHYRAWYIDNVLSDPFRGSKIDFDTILQINFVPTQSYNIDYKVRIAFTYTLYFDIVFSWCETWVFPNRYKKMSFYIKNLKKFTQSNLPYLLLRGVRIVEQTTKIFLWV